MKIGILCDGNIQRLDWIKQNGFGSFAWNRFDGSAVATSKDWRGLAEAISAHARGRGLRISAIDAHYKNPLDPEQSEYARGVFKRAIEVASHIGVRTVCGFPGAVIELEKHPKGNNPIYKSYEQFLPMFLDFWEPIAKFASDKGVRLAFEHCPMGPFHLPIMGYNMFSQPAIWERFFNDARSANMGIEWDASHLMCQFIDPVENIHRFGSRVFHVHAKDAFINRRIMEIYGICHDGVAEHRSPGFGQANWSEIVHALYRAGYDSDLNIEGWHDPVFRDHGDIPPADIKLANTTAQAGQKLEDAGLLIAKRHLEQFVSAD
jgi:sugar phosphate isomerase/epimerase